MRPQTAKAPTLAPAPERSTIHSVADSAWSSAEHSWTIALNSASCDDDCLSFVAFSVSSSSSGNIPTMQPKMTPAAWPSCDASRGRGSLSCACDSPCGGMPNHSATRSMSPPAHTPSASEKVLPSAAAAIVEKPNATPSVRSIWSPTRIITKLSMKPKPTNGIDACSATMRSAWPSTTPSGSALLEAFEEHARKNSAPRRRLVIGSALSNSEDEFRSA